MKRQRGIALLGVLWAGVILALLAGGVTNVSRGDLDLARNQLETARAELAAEAAAEIAILGLINGGEDAISENGAIYAWEFDGSEVRVQVMPESGRFDLNRSDEFVLAALFGAAGAHEDVARSLAHAVIDYRDEDNIRMELGAEDDDYEAEGYFLGAKDAPFASVQELAGVMGMTPEIYRLAIGGLSVHVGRRGGGAEIMPAIVAAAINEAGFAATPASPPFSAELAATPRMITDPLSEFDGRTALSHVHAEAVTQGGAIFVLDMVVQARAGPRGVYQLIDRRRGEVELFDMEASRPAE